MTTRTMKKLMMSLTAAGMMLGAWTSSADDLYCVIDLSGGPSAANYPVSYLSTVPKGGWTDEYKTTKLVLRKIPAGKFTMGPNEYEYHRWISSWEIGSTYRYYEIEPHTVTISKAFYIGVFEVTQKQYELVTGVNPSSYRGDNRPVVKVSWDDIRGNSSWPGSADVAASSFLGKLRAKAGIADIDMPTEAQWEYACRAGTSTSFSNGKNLTSFSVDPSLNEIGHYQFTASGAISDRGASVVGSFTPNGWGLYDMHGNAWEWTLNWSQWVTADNVAVDPVGPTSGSRRVLRGGGWTTAAHNCRSASCLEYGPANRADDIGFRVCWSTAADPAAAVKPVLCPDVDGAVPATAASEYNGYLVDKKGVVKGTIQVKVGKPNAKTMQAAVKATVVLSTKKFSLKAADKGKAEILADGPTTVELAGNGAEACSVTLGAEGLSGNYGTYAIDGARNFFASKDKAEQTAANAVLGKWLGPVNVVWDGGSVNISIAAKGKAKAKGTLADGKTKVSVNSTFLVGKEWCCIPVAAPKANLAFLVWLPKDGGEMVVDGLGDDVLVGVPTPGGSLKFTLGLGFEAIAGVQKALLPTTFGFGGGLKWTFSKADTVKLVGDGAAITKDNGNPSGLKMTYKAKDGSFNGKFSVYAVESGKLKKYSATVTGVMIGAKGYGSAVIKKPAVAADVTIE